MTPEVTALALAGLLHAVQFAVYSVAAQRQVGPAVAMGPRDTRPELTGTAGRLQRAFANHVEGLMLFTLAVVVVTLSGQSSAITRAAAFAYLGARVLYVPAYAFGWVPWRSFIWAAGMAATVTMILASLIR